MRNFRDYLETKRIVMHDFVPKSQIHENSRFLTEME